MLFVVAVLLQRYVYGAVACITVEVMEPLNCAQVGLVGVNVTCAICDGLIVVDADMVHPAASVTVTEYVVGDRLVMLVVVAAVDHRKVYGDVPLVAVAVALPLSSPQVVVVGVNVTVGAVGAIMLVV